VHEKVLIKAQDFGVAPHALMFDPQFYVFDFNPVTRKTRFLVVDEEHLDLAPFIDIRFESMAKCSFALPSMELFAMENQHGVERPRVSFIFHHAFVCSTLLARCLGQSGAFFSLKEPWILRRLADVKRSPGLTIPDPQWKQIFTAHLALLARNYRSGKSPVIKATNVANNLIGDVFRYLPDRGVLYLYSDLRSFLVSNLKKTKDTQSKMPDLANSFIKDEDFARRFPQYCDLRRLSFLQICALIWLVSLYNFRTSVERSRSSKARTLDMHKFLQWPADTVSALSTFFGHSPGESELAAMVGPSVMNSNAKDPRQAYGTEARRIEAEQVIALHRRDIEQAFTWAKPIEEELALLEGMRTLDLLQGRYPE
jgi:hypothetical protein